MNTHETLGSTPPGRTFEFIQCLGRGGFGEVYLAHMFTPGLQVPAQVAIKMLHDQVAPGSDAAARLKDEARVTVLLGHPGILQVLDLMELGGRLALVTEYVDGQDLGDCVTQGMPRRAIVEALALVSAALGAAHDAGVVHRDVKPANIRVGRHGQCKLLDFGIAHASTLSREAHTASGLIVGSQGYMSPERLRGIVHGGADIFAIGCVLYEGLSGRRLFENVGPGHLVGICFDKEVYDEFIADRLAEIKAPRSVLGLLHMCLEHDPSQRIDGATLATRLQQVAPRLRGDALAAWCRQREWPQTAIIDGTLTGTTLSEWAPPTGSTPVIPPDGPTAPLAASLTPRRSRVGLWVSLAAMPVVLITLILLGSAAAAVAGSLWYSGALSSAPSLAAQNAAPTAEPSSPPDPLPAEAAAQPLPEPPTTRASRPSPASNGGGSSSADHKPSMNAPTRVRPTITQERSPMPVDSPAEANLTLALDAPEPVEISPAAPKPVEPKVVQSSPPPSSQPASPASSGEVTITGGVSVRLIDSDGAAHTPGRLATGTYDVQALFRERWQASGRVSVERGSRVELFCSDRMQRCVQR